MEALTDGSLPGHRHRPPARISWEILGSLDAAGDWLIADADAGAAVSFVVTYDPGSARGLIDLPAFVSFDWVADRVTEKIAEEGQRVVERVVEDLEGEPRPVELDVTLT